jgi:hypothetical protein
VVVPHRSFDPAGHEPSAEPTDVASMR